MSQAPTDTSRQWPQRLRRREASAYLAAVHGIRLSPNTLASLASTGGGPRYRHDGHYPLYEQAELDAFAAKRLGPSFATAREHRAGEARNAL